MGEIIPQPHGGAIYRASKWETRNPNGRPRKGVSYVNHELQKLGYEPAQKQDIQETYIQMIQLSEQELKAIGTDKKQPMLVRVLAKAILNPTKWFDNIERMLDRAVGKPQQKDDLNVTVATVDITDDQKYKIAERMLQDKKAKEKKTKKTRARKSRKSQNKTDS